MDRAQVSGTWDVGPIPTGGTFHYYTKKPPNLSGFYIIKSLMII